jgi:hypothetical protein
MKMQAMSNCVRKTQGKIIKKIESAQMINPIECPILIDLCADFKLLTVALAVCAGRICELCDVGIGFVFIVAGGAMASGMTLMPRARFRSSRSAASSFKDIARFAGP